MKKEICDSRSWFRSALQQKQAFKGAGKNYKKAMDGRKALENTLAPWLVIWPQTWLTWVLLPALHPIF